MKRKTKTGFTIGVLILGGDGKNGGVMLFDASDERTITIISELAADSVTAKKYIEKHKKHLKALTEGFIESL